MNTVSRRRFCTTLLASTVGAGLAAGLKADQAVAAGQQVSSEQQLDRLLDQLDRVESVRAVKRLQWSCAQYIQFGLWQEIAALFSEQGEFVVDDKVVSGATAIENRFRDMLGGGEDGLPVGAVHSALLMAPIVTLAPDGMTAQGRWHDVAMSGRLHGQARWAGGIQDNDYVREDGVWKIARLHYHLIFSGDYETGWTNVVPDLPVIPYRYTSAQAGMPATALASSSGDVSPPAAPFSEIARRIAALNDEDEVRNLQNAYGYYVDRKMWDDVVDLFAPDGTLDIEGIGRFTGKAQIRKALERDGPAGLAHGELNDHPQLNTLVSVSPSGATARARGLDLAMTGHNGQNGYWSLTCFDNLFVRRHGVWTIAAMRLYPVMKTDYDKGWAKSELVVAPAPGKVRKVPAFFPHPVTKRPIFLPAGFEVAGMPTFGKGSTARAVPDSVDKAEIALRRSAAWDAIENDSSALGACIDDFRWEELSELFTLTGMRKSPDVGFYVGRDHVLKMEIVRNGRRRTPRAFLPMHLRLQPVINVSDDATSAMLRTRLLQFNSIWQRPGSMFAGMYECELRLDNGIWKFQVDAINHIWRSPSYKQGWVHIPENGGKPVAQPIAPIMHEFPPDKPIEGPPFKTFPDVAQLRFHYRNPVSGRKPPSLISF
jgi:hypothetical protein